MAKITTDRDAGFKIYKAKVKVTAYNAGGSLETDSVEILKPRGDVAVKETIEYFEYTSSTCEFPIKYERNKRKIEGTCEVQDVNVSLAAKFLGGTLTVDGTIGAATEVTGTVLSDMTSSGAFSGGLNTTYLVEIVSAATPDTYAVSLDNGTTWISSGTACTSEFVELHDGVTGLWAATSGHTLGDSWTIAVTGVSGRLDRALSDTQPFPYGARIQLIDKNNDDLIKEIVKCDIITEEIDMSSSDANNLAFVLGFRGLQPASASTVYVKDGSTSVE